MAVLAVIAAFTLGLAGASWSSVEFLDLTATDSNLKGFNGGFTDGAFGYLVPWSRGAVRFGSVVRFDLQSFAGVEVLDLTSVDPDLEGFMGGFAHSSFGYLVPWANGAGCFGKLARFDLLSFGNVEVLDLTSVDPDLRCFAGNFVDGSFGYLAPYGFSSKVVRFSLNSFGAVDVLDLAATHPGLKGFHGCFSDGSFGYLVPYHDGGYHGKVTRFSLTSFGDVEVLDLTATDSDLRGFIGGFADASFGYLLPYYNGKGGKVVRFDLQSFKAEAVEVLDLTSTDPDLTGFHGGFSDGSFGYLVPFQNGWYYGKAVRFNLQSFGGVEVLDLTSTDAELIGFAGSFTDGSSGYLVPRIKGKVARFATATTTTTVVTTTGPLLVSCSLSYLICPLPVEWDTAHYTLLGSATVPACQPRHDGSGTAVINASVSECNVSQTKTLDSVLLEATIAPSAGLLVFDVHVLHCTCTVAMAAGTHAGFSVKDPAVLHVSGNDSFEVSPLDVYTDSSYEDELQHNASLALDSRRFFFQVSAMKPSVHVAVKGCAAALSAEQEDPYKHIFLTNFCPIGGKLDFQGISYSEHHVARFSTKSFKFALTRQVHVTCTVVRCAQSPCGQCGRRLAGEQLETAFVSVSTTIDLLPAADVAVILKPVAMIDGTAAIKAFAGVFIGLVSTSLAV